MISFTVGYEICTQGILFKIRKGSLQPIFFGNIVITACLGSSGSIKLMCSTSLLLKISQKIILVMDKRLKK